MRWKHNWVYDYCVVVIVAGKGAQAHTANDRPFEIIFILQIFLRELFYYSATESMLVVDVWTLTSIAETTLLLVCKKYIVNNLGHFEQILFCRML